MQGGSTFFDGFGDAGKHARSAIGVAESLWRRLLETGAPDETREVIERLLQEARDAVGDDPFAYGVKDNRAMLETAINYSYEQGFIPEKPKVEDLMVESCRDL